MVEFYISRLDGFVLIERSTGMPLLLTPQQPEQMVEQIHRLVQGR